MTTRCIDGCECRFFDGTAFQYRSAMEKQKGRAILSCTAFLLPETKKQNFVVYFPGYPA